VIYREFEPSPRLRSIVDRLWWLEGSPASIAADPIPPDGHTEIIVHAGEPFAQREADSSWRVQEPLLLAGQATRAVHVEPRGYARLVGARLTPDGAYALFGQPQYEIVDRIADLRDIDRVFARRLRDEVAVLDDGPRMVAALDRTLQIAVPDRLEPSVAHGAVRIAIASHGLVRVADLARQVDVGSRQLERVFHERIGLSPKVLLRILRFQQVLRTLRGGETRNRWAEVAVDNGFYDQAHFIHDFRSFVGESPSAFQVTDESLAAAFSAILRSPSR
jgi:AraC-like DNA-binding protein